MSPGYILPWQMSLWQLASFEHGSKILPLKLAKLGQYRLIYSWYGQMLPGWILPGQMWQWQLVNWIRLVYWVSIKNFSFWSHLEVAENLVVVVGWWSRPVLGCSLNQVKQKRLHINQIKGKFLSHNEDQTWKKCLAA